MPQNAPCLNASVGAACWSCVARKQLEHVFSRVRAGHMPQPTIAPTALFSTPSPYRLLRTAHSAAPLFRAARAASHRHRAPPATSCNCYAGHPLTGLIMHVDFEAVHQVHRHPMRARLTPRPHAALPQPPHPLRLQSSCRSSSRQRRKASSCASCFPHLANRRVFTKGSHGISPLKHCWPATLLCSLHKLKEQQHPQQGVPPPSPSILLVSAPR